MGCCHSEPLLKRETLTVKEIALIVDVDGSTEDKVQQCLQQMRVNAVSDDAVAKCIEQLATICGSQPNRVHAVKLGALDATIAAMRATHNQQVQHWGCALVCMAAKGTDTGGFERKELAAEAGAIQAVIHAMRENQSFEPLVTLACAALANIIVGDDALSLSRAESATSHDAIPLVVMMLRAHGSSHAVQYYGRSLLTRLCRVTSGRDPDAKAALARDSGAKEEWLEEQPALDRRRPLMDTWQCSVRISAS